MPIRIRYRKNPFTSESLSKGITDLWGWLGWTNWHWWVAYDGPEWVAYAALCHHDKDALYCGPTFVKPLYRGRGLQRRLLAHRERYARKHGYTRLVSSTNSENEYSIRNLLAAGFLKFTPWATSTETCFEKIL